MTRDYTIRDTCRLCYGPISDPILDLGETALANEYVADPETKQDSFPLYLVECLSCGHVQMPVIVSPERLYARQYLYQSGTSPVYRAHLEAYADEITERCGKNLKILEVGSNDGTFLKMLRARGHTVLGVDPAGTGEGVIRAFFGAHLVDRVLDNLQGPADVVVANHVFAHVADLPSLTEAIRDVLRVNGTFVIEVGDGTAVLQHGLFDQIYHEHMDYHTVRALVPFLERHRFATKMFRYGAAQGGSLRVWSAAAHANSRSRPVIVRADVGRLQESIARCAIDVPAAAFGACAKLTTFLAATRTADQIQKVYDDNPAKVGLYTPGSHIPIVAAREILTDNPPAVLVTAWNFYSEIRDRLRTWGYRGDIVRALPSYQIDQLEAAA